MANRQRRLILGGGTYGLACLLLLAQFPAAHARELDADTRLAYFDESNGEEDAGGVSPQGVHYGGEPLRRILTGYVQGSF